MPVQYENAPITEALIDIRVAKPASLTPRELESLYEKVKDLYPHKKQRFDVHGQLTVGEEIGASASRTPSGFAFSSEDGKQIFQAKLDGFTLSRLRPYGNWPDLRDEAKRLWSIYRSIVQASIVRVAVRYINQIDLPPGRIDYGDYFLTRPEVGPGLPQELSGFLMQLHFPQSDFGGMLILTQAEVLPPPLPRATAVILDLDVFKEAEIATDEEAWELLEHLRNRKNEFFEGCITEKARQLFGRRTEY